MLYREGPFEEKEENPKRRTSKVLSNFLSVMVPSKGKDCLRSLHRTSGLGPLAWAFQELGVGTMLPLG